MCAGNICHDPMKKHFHEIRDPIHVFVRLDSDERQVLNSAPFQRLRHIHQLALTYLIYVLIVVSVGGLGSIWGSFAAAMLLGISDTAGKYYVPAIGAFLIYLVMISLLMWRPLGLLGRR